MDCAVGGDYINRSMEREQVLSDLKDRNFCERGEYSIVPVQVGGFTLYSVRYCASPVNPILESFNEAVEGFLSLVHGI